MSGSILGRNFQISTWGESHGKALGVVIDGCPAGIELFESDIQIELDRRKPGSRAYATKRAESDCVHILSGVFENKTTGTPISLIVYNEDQHSADYSEISDIYRPGHADFTFDKKYGFRDYRGGGRSSGRETISRVAAGAVAKKILSELGITIIGYTYSIGEITCDRNLFDMNERFKNPFVMPDKKAACAAAVFLDECMKNKDSAGGVAELLVKGLPIGIGEPVFNKLDAALAQAIMSVGAVKGIEIGSGFEASKKRGSENNDAFYSDKLGGIGKRTNFSGGVLGGISDGSTLILRAAFKPTPSISASQETISSQGDNTVINIKGRHDPVIVPRAIVVMEAMAAITITDLLFQSMTSTMDSIKKYFSR